MKGPGVILGILFAVVILFFGVGQTITAEATYIPAASSGVKALLHPLDFYILLMTAMVVLGAIIGVVTFATGRR